jgi:hypothetical protein
MRAKYTGGSKSSTISLIDSPLNDDTVRNDLGDIVAAMDGIVGFATIASSNVTTEEKDDFNFTDFAIDELLAEDKVPVCSLDGTPNQRPATSTLILMSLGFRDTSSSWSLFERSTFSDPGFAVSYDMALHILRSYSYMLAGEDNVPPFVHLQYKAPRVSNSTRPSPCQPRWKFQR